MKQKQLAGFGDALAEVTGIRDTFGYGHSAVCLDDLWSVCDFTVFTDPQRHDCWTALEWAHCAILNDVRTSRVVLLSGVCSRRSASSTASRSSVRTATSPASAR